MNRYSIIASLALGSLLLVGCRQEDMELTEPHIDKPAIEQGAPAYTQDTRYTMTDVIRVRFARPLGERIEKALRSEGALRSADLEAEGFLGRIQAESLERVFPHAGKWEERTRREGLHLWYDIKLKPQSDPAVALQMREQAIALAEQYAGVTIAERVQLYELPDVKPILFTESMGELRSGTTERPTDDPLLPRQWHYHNEGNFVRAKKGADINLYEAWQVEMGKPNVLVAIVDGGIDIEHEDLNANIHINTDERDGTPGVDDDNNGLVDDIYGYNFAMGQSKIVPHDHGTHVAGTVAARSNNHLGVAGVAGGNGDADSGIRLISCQTFATNPLTGRKMSGGFDRAIKYGADAGAVISQNSWGQPHSTRLPASYKEAIDYFVKYAGCDNKGDQLEGPPMKGGVVIFAAGNEGYEYAAALASYKEVIAVTSMAPNFEASYFTTYGTWADIMAPGGDMYYHNGQVLSTLPGNKYGYMQGTSMACPHVSGIAALVVSRHGGRGFTNEDLKRRLTTSLRPERINAINPRLAGKLGAGYIDAALALADGPSEADLSTNTAPEAIQWAEPEVTHRGLSVRWLVPKDAEEGVAFGYRLYAQSASFSEAELPGLEYADIKEPQAQLGAVLQYSFQGLKADTEYYFALVAYDKWGHMGSPTFKTIRTLSNNAPKITMPEIAPIRIAGEEVYTLALPVSDVDGHSWTWRIVGQSHGAVVTKTAEGLEVQLRVRGAVGKYVLTLEVEDELGATDQVEIPFEIYTNRAPVLMTRFARLYIVRGTTEEIDLMGHFADPDGDALTFAVRPTGKGTSQAALQGSKLTLTAGQSGRSAFEITATDAKGLSTKSILEVEATTDELVQLVYPTPATTTLNIRVLRGISAIQTVVYTATGSRILSRSLTVGKSSVASLDIAQLASGSYVVEVSAAGKTMRKPFTKR